MYINLESDYAIRIVISLAKAKGRLDSSKISESSNVTLRFSLKILGKLVSAGLVKSFKGTTGGYELAKKANEITLLDVIEIVEGEYVVSRCLRDEKDCNNNCDEICKVKNVFSKITNLIRENLKNVTFDSLIDTENII